jgi:hypothetical protein
MWGWNAAPVALDSHRNDSEGTLLPHEKHEEGEHV